VKALILMHNIDVIHQEHNVGESILSTCMSFVDTAKDNHKARKDLALICNRPSLELKSCSGKPRAPFCLKARDRKEVLIWLKKSKIPRWLHRRFQESCKFGHENIKWSEKS
jgi:hypothetical protein